MKAARFALLALPPLLLSITTLFAEDKQPLSPLDTVNSTISGAEIKVVYSRPFTKDPKTGEMRKIWGGLVPYSKLWRTGANKATTLTTSQALEIGSTTVPAGTYSLFTIPEENGGKLIINKETGQSGLKRDEAQDLAKVEMKRSANDKAPDQFTVAIESKDAGGVLKLMWENAEYSVPFTVKK